MWLADLTAPQIDALSQDTVVVLPIAAIEQHGPHLPLVTDTCLLTGLLQSAHAEVDDRTLIAPVQWWGNSHHHLDFPGTLSAPPGIYVAMLQGLVDTVLAHGFRRILLLNGHGGNDIPARQAMFQVRQTHRQRDDLLLLTATYWTLAPQPPAEVIQGLHQSDMGHACEWETSMMLHLAPHLVGAHKELPDVATGDGFKPANRAWTTRQRSSAGYLGAPSAASAEKGQALLGLFHQGLVSLIDRMVAWDGHSWAG
ncbi:MAG: creatininase family protein [Planctomycetota bacterium]|nr:MAG: creatininase family protein [Planctomycetota bacterium]